MDTVVYPPLESPEPRIFSDDDFRAWEDALQKLAVVDAILKRCERCKLPTQATRADCDQLCSFFQALIAEFKGPQSPLPHR